MLIYRHGDVLIRQIDKLPEGLSKKPDTILAYGEATGHNHQVVTDRPDLLDMRIDVATGKIYFQTETEVQITHQEHKTITIEPGSFVIDIERERDPFTESIRKVMD